MWILELWRWVEVGRGWIKGDPETADTALIDRCVVVGRNPPSQAHQEWKDHLLLAVMHMH